MPPALLLPRTLGGAPTHSTNQHSEQLALQIRTIKYCIGGNFHQEKISPAIILSTIIKFCPLNNCYGDLYHMGEKLFFLYKGSWDQEEISSSEFFWLYGISQPNTVE